MRPDSPSAKVSEGFGLISAAQMPHFGWRKLRVEPCWVEGTLKGVWLNPLHLQVREFEAQRG